MTNEEIVHNMSPENFCAGLKGMVFDKMFSSVEFRITCNKNKQQKKHSQQQTKVEILEKIRHLEEIASGVSETLNLPSEFKGLRELINRL